MTFTVEHICVWRGSKLEDEESKLLVKTQKKLNQLIEVIQNSPKIGVVHFLKLLPVENILGRVRMSEERLDALLKKYE